MSEREDIELFYELDTWCTHYFQHKHKLALFWCLQPFSVEHLNSHDLIKYVSHFHVFFFIRTLSDIVKQWHHCPTTRHPHSCAHAFYAYIRKIVWLSSVSLRSSISFLYLLLVVVFFNGYTALKPFRSIWLDEFRYSVVFRCFCITYKFHSRSLAQIIRSLARSLVKFPFLFSLFYRFTHGTNSATAYIYRCVCAYIESCTSMLCKKE